MHAAATALALFLTILPHEFGHAVAARVTGMQGVHIHLSALGGFCAYDPRSSTHAKGLLISLSGVTVNFFIAALCFGYFSLIDQVALPNWLYSNEREQIGWLVALLMSDLLRWNIVLGIFNLLPIWPLDGGRALYELLSWPGKIKQRSVKRFVFGASVVSAIGIVALLAANHCF